MVVIWVCGYKNNCVITAENDANDYGEVDGNNVYCIDSSVTFVHQTQVLTQLFPLISIIIIWYSAILLYAIFLHDMGNHGSP